MKSRPYWHVAQLAAAQRFIDNGVSKTVNMPYDAGEKTLPKFSARPMPAAARESPFTATPAAASRY